MVAGLLGAVGLFIATNIDDIIVLSLFFARGAGQAGTTLRILAGQYLGFAGILAVTILVTLGADAFLPTEAIPYFGLIPLTLGLWAAWQAWQGDDDDDDAKVSGKNVSVLTVAGVTFANGGDNIGVYVPVFRNVEIADVQNPQRGASVRQNPACQVAHCKQGRLDTRAPHTCCDGARSTYTHGQAKNVLCVHPFTLPRNDGRMLV